MLSPIYEQCLQAYNKGGFTAALEAAQANRITDSRYCEPCEAQSLCVDGVCAACGSVMETMFRYKFVFSGQSVEEAIEIQAPDALTATRILEQEYPELGGIYTLLQWGFGVWFELD